jgi:hypothetical protein
MALETLRGIDRLDGFQLIVMDELRLKFPDKFNESGAMDWPWFEKEVRPKNFIYLRHDKNSLSFTLQNGPIRDNGINGCQVDTLVAASIEILRGLNKAFPCRENSLAITKLQEGYFWLKERRRDRENRGVEGINAK